MEKQNSQIELCYSRGLLVNPKWPWLGASPYSLAKDLHGQINMEQWKSNCPASTADLTITEACNDKSFFLELKDEIKLKRNHIYYYQCQSVMAICQLSWLEFVVFTKNDHHVEREFCLMSMSG